jgi:acetyl esterase
VTSYRFDPELAPLVDQLPRADLTDLAATREQIDGFLGAFSAGVDTTGIEVRDISVPGPDGAPSIPARTYRPDGPSSSPRPCLLDIHGGGFVIGQLEMQHPTSVEMARDLDIVVVTLNYRLAPEHPFPAGLDDCYATLSWIHEHADELGVDPARVGIGGQSAGGGLAAGLALLARDRGGPAVCFQMLGIPELDHRLETTSMRTFVDTPLWHRPNAELSWQHYLGADRSDVSPYASPSLAADLIGLPPAYVSTMEYDPLRDEGIQYALRLLGAGVPVELHSFPGTFHGSAMFTTAAVSQRAHREMLDAIRRGLGVTSTPA